MSSKMGMEAGGNWGPFAGLNVGLLKRRAARGKARMGRDLRGWLGPRAARGRCCRLITTHATMDYIICQI